MNRSLLLAPALALLALPALAQPAPQPAPTRALSQETMGGQRGPMPAGSAAREAAAADRGGLVQGPAGWLKAAEDALRRGRLAEANELLERAETRALSRAAPAPLAGQPARGPMLEHSAAARAALAEHDRARAMQQLELALAAARDQAGSTTGAQPGPMPAQGGSGMRQGMGDDIGGPMGPGMSRDSRITRPGRASLRDQGVAATTMARADHLTPPALPPRRLLLAQSSQAPANSMTESQRAMPGQREPRAASPNVAPPGPSTLPAPRAGAGAPMQGRTGGSGAASQPSLGGSAGMGAPPPAGGSAR